MRKEQHRKQQKKVWWRSIVVLALFAVSTIVQPFSLTANAITTPGSSQGLVVGAYNVYACLNGHNYKQRMQTVAKNIVQLGYDVVGMTEYNYRTCWNMVLDELNKLGGQWNHTKQTSKDYTANQASIIWNASSVTLVSEEIFDMDTPSNKGTGKGSHDGSGYDGGSRYMHIARFRDKSGKEFVVANAHFLTVYNGVRSNNAASTHRVKELTNAMNRLKTETVPVFITGDTNASPSTSVDNKFFAAAKSGGYASARTTSANPTNGLWGTMADSSTRAEFAIDQIFYKNVAAPSYYETLGCKSIAECGSDHRPIKAVFSDLTGSGGALTCITTPSSNTAPLQDQTNPMLLNSYRTYNNIAFTGGSTVCCSSGVLSGDLVGNTIAEKVYSYLVSTPIATNGGKPLNAAQAAGAIGNLMVESGGNTYDLKPDAVNPNSKAYGIVQWLGSRKTALTNFAGSRGTEVSDLKTQVEFIVYELEKSESAIVKDATFKNVPLTAAGAEVAAARWDKLYERSGGGTVGLRKTNANKAFTDFSDGAVTTSSDAAADPSGTTPADGSTGVSTLSLNNTNSMGCADSAMSGEYIFPLSASKVDLRKWGANPGTTEWKSGRYHEGVFPGYLAVDIMAPEGTPVIAFHAGQVIDVGVDRNIYGALNVQIKDSEGYTYYYQHLSSSRGAKVKKGDTVSAGTLIAYVGSDREGWCSKAGYNCGGKQSHLHIDKSKNPGTGLRGSCSATSNYCPIAKEGRFAPIVVELHNSFEAIAEQGTGSGQPAL